MSLLAMSYRRAAFRIVVGVVDRSSPMTFAAAAATTTAAGTKLRFSSLPTSVGDNYNYNDDDQDDHLRNSEDHRRCNEANRGIIQIQETPDGKGLGLFAARNFAAGELVMASQPTRVTTVRDSHTVQIDWNSHMMMDLPSVLINHSCNANVGIQNNASSSAYDFLAMTSISEGEELTWDYEASEWELSSPFDCGCGNKYCRGRLSGFKYNGAVIRQQYGKFIANYLKDAVVVLNNDNTN